MSNYKPEIVLVPHHELSYSEEERRDVNSFTVEEIKKFDKQAAVHYARAVGLQETGMSVNEVGLMYDLLEKKQPKHIVELGRNYACSTRLYLQYVVRHPGTFLESWDLKHWGNVRESWGNQGFRTEDFGVEDYFIFDGDRKIAWIRNADSIKTPILPFERWVDFLLIDTEHGIENALFEYGRWRQYLRAGALIAFHDSTLPGVVRSIDLVKEIELVTCGERILKEYHNERVDGYGVCVLEWKG